MLVLIPISLVITTLVIAFSGMIASGTFALLSVSYGIILFSLKNHSAEGRQKALSTCGSHITVVILFFVPVIFIYLRPPTTFPEDKIFALFYTIIAPMFNPLIYTLRNTEMKTTLKKLVSNVIFKGSAQLLWRSLLAKQLCKRKGGGYEWMGQQLSQVLGTITTLNGRNENHRTIR